jgi:hypothetical protein
MRAKRLFVRAAVGTMKLGGVIFGDAPIHVENKFLFRAALRNGALVEVSNDLALAVKKQSKKEQ